MLLYTLSLFLERERETWNQDACVKVSKQQSWFSSSILRVPGLKLRQPCSISSFHCQVVPLAQHAAVALLRGCFFLFALCVCPHMYGEVDLTPTLNVGAENWTPVHSCYWICQLSHLRSPVPFYFCVIPFIFSVLEQNPKALCVLGAMISGS